MTPQERAHWRRTESQKSPKCVGKAALQPGHYKTFRIMKVDRITECVYKYTFELLPDESIGLGAGQHAMLRVWEKEGVAITRPYTPISPLAQLGSLKSSLRNGTLEPQQTEGAIGHLHLHTQHVRKGWHAGVRHWPCPLVQLARSIVDNENDITFVHMLYCCRTQHDILMKEELDRLASFWNFTVLYALSASSKEEAGTRPWTCAIRRQSSFGRIGQMEVASCMPTT
eukprot:Em0657g2a